VHRYTGLAFVLKRVLCLSKVSQSLDNKYLLQFPQCSFAHGTFYVHVCGRVSLKEVPY